MQSPNGSEYGAEHQDGVENVEGATEGVQQLIVEDAPNPPEVVGDAGETSGQRTDGQIGVDHGRIDSEVKIPINRGPQARVEAQQGERRSEVPVETRSLDNIKQIGESVQTPREVDSSEAPSGIGLGLQILKDGHKVLATTEAARGIWDKAELLKKRSV